MPFILWAKQNYKLTGTNMCLIFNDDTKLLMVGIVLFEFAKIKGAKKFYVWSRLLLGQPN